mgnify:CR=1 FL=1
MSEAAKTEEPAKETVKTPTVAETMEAFKKQYTEEIAKLKNEIAEKDKKHAQEIAEILTGAEKRKQEEEAERKKRGDALKESVNRVRASLGLEIEK